MDSENGLGKWTLGSSARPGCAIRGRDCTPAAGGLQRVRGARRRGPDRRRCPNHDQSESAGSRRDCFAGRRPRQAAARRQVAFWLFSRIEQLQRAGRRHRGFVRGSWSAALVDAAATANGAGTARCVLSRTWRVVGALGRCGAGAGGEPQLQLPLPALSRVARVLHPPPPKQPVCQTKQPGGVDEGKGADGL
jgi:hypothetical protein